MVLLYIRRLLRTAPLIHVFITLGCSPSQEALKTSDASDASARMQRNSQGSAPVEIVFLDFKARTATTYGELTLGELPLLPEGSPDAVALSREIEAHINEWRAAGSTPLRVSEGTPSGRAEVVASMGVGHGAERSMALSGGNRGCIVITGRALAAAATLLAANVPVDSPAWICSCAIGVVGLCMATVRR